MESNYTVGNSNTVYMVKNKNGMCAVDVNSLTTKRINRTQDIRAFLNNINKKPYFESMNEYIEDDDKILVTFVTGFDCNYSCEYCYQNQKKGDECNHLTSNDIDRVVDFYEWLGEKNNKKYIITAIDIVGGEPLLPNNFEIIKYLFDKFNNAQITITTNGTYLMKYFDLLNENKDRVFLKVSIDGEKTQHYKRRKPANEAFYDMTIQAIRNMVNVGINIAVSCVFDATYLEYQSFLNELEELGWPKRKNISLNLLPKLRCGSDGMDIAEVVENISSLKTFLACPSFGSISINLIF